jgi:hypothetical protein
MLNSALRLRGVVFVVIAGCGTQAAPLYPLAEKPASPPPLASRYDSTSTGSIRGRIVWNGPVPASTSFRDAGVFPGSFALGIDALNRLVPRIDGKSNSVAGAVVFLRKIDPERSRPWDLPPVRVVMKSSLIAAEQDGEHLTGFVHAGDSIEMFSRDEQLESLRARGAAFFTLAFPKSSKPISRVLPHAGQLELSSAVGHFWARCWLFVVEHPYYVRTDESGSFQLDRVPDGTYELVCWLPDWRVERFERDPETFAVARLWFRKPLEKSMAVRVERGQINQVHFAIAEADFGK